MYASGKYDVRIDAMIFHCNAPCKSLKNCVVSGKAPLRRLRKVAEVYRGRQGKEQTKEKRIDKIAVRVTNY